MPAKLKNWLRRLLFNLLKDDIKGLIVQEVCHLDPPTTPKEVGWSINTSLLERPRATDVSWSLHRGIANYLEVRYKLGAQTKKTCVPCPPDGVDTKEYLLGRPEALL